MRLGLESLEETAPDLVLIHDGARPFVSAAVITRVLAALDGAPGASAALPLVDTLKRDREAVPKHDHDESLGRLFRGSRQRRQPPTSAVGEDGGEARAAALARARATVSELL